MRLFLSISTCYKVRYLIQKAVKYVCFKILRSTKYNFRNRLFGQYKNIIYLSSTLFIH
jgi:hypothetical protein